MKNKINKIIISLFTWLLAAAVLSSCGLPGKGFIEAAKELAEITSEPKTSETVPAKGHEALKAEIEEAVKRGDAQVRVRCDSMQDACEAMDEIRYKPEYFYLGDIIEYEFDGFWCLIKFNNRFDDIVAARAQVKNNANQVLSLIPEDADDYTKALTIHDWMVWEIDYDEEAVNSQDIYGALVDRKCVCGGYAMAFEYLMELAGISCDYYTGTAYDESGGGSHAWNSAVLDGEIYYFDVTWDDPITVDDKIRRNYFAVTYDEISLNHFPDEGVVMPYTDAYECNYYVRNDYIVWDASVDEIVRMIDLQGSELTFKCADSEIYEGIFDILSDGSLLYDIITLSGLDSSGCLSGKDAATRVFDISFY